MPVRNSIVAIALIVATMITAAGLNLAVMGLDRNETTSSAGEGVAGVFSSPARDSQVSEVELTAAAVVPVSVPTRVLAVRSSPLTRSHAGADPSSPIISADARTASPVPSSAPSSVGSATTPGPPPSALSAPGHATSTSTSDPASSPPSSRPPSTGPTTPVSTEYLTYEFEGIASIVIALHDGRTLEFWSVSPERGWVFLVEDRGPRKVKIKFRPAEGGEEAEFELGFEDGRLRAKREY